MSIKRHQPASSLPGLSAKFVLTAIEYSVKAFGTRASLRFIRLGVY